MQHRAVQSDGSHGQRLPGSVTWTLAPSLSLTIVVSLDAGGALAGVAADPAVLSALADGSDAESGWPFACASACAIAPRCCATAFFRASSGTVRDRVSVPLSIWVSIFAPL